MRRSGLRSRSLRRQRLYTIRRRIVAKGFAEHPTCQVPWCRRPSTDPHEPLTRARGGSILDPANIRYICSEHHREITDTEPAWAYPLGFLVHSWEARNIRSGNPKEAL